MLYTTRFNLRFKVITQLIISIWIQIQSELCKCNTQSVSCQLWMAACWIDFCELWIINYELLTPARSNAFHLINNNCKVYIKLGTTRWKGFDGNQFARLAGEGGKGRGNFQFSINGINVKTEENNKEKREKQIRSIKCIWCTGKWNWNQKSV